MKRSREESNVLSGLSGCLRRRIRDLVAADS